MLDAAMQHHLKQYPGTEVSSTGEINPVSMVKINAMTSIAYMESTNSMVTFGTAFGGGAAAVSPRDRTDGFLFDYNTSASFSLFLLDLGSSEDYKRFYTDKDLSEEIYGMDFETLVHVWFNEYLNADDWIDHFMEFLSDE